MTDDEYLALFRAASPKAQRQAIMIGLALLDFIQRKKAAKRQRQNAPATADSVETQTVKPETPAPLVVIPTSVNNVPVGETLDEICRRRRRELGIKGYDD